MLLVKKSDGGWFESWEDLGFFGLEKMLGWVCGWSRKSS